jgi:sarcosine oxidase
VEIRTAKETYTANSVVFSAGAWLPQLVPDLNLPLQCERQILFWFKPYEQTNLFTTDKMPVFLWQMKNKRFFYGIPDVGDGVKVARHHGGEFTSPDRVRREITQLDEAPVREFLKRHIPSINAPPALSATCLYTHTSDEHFIIDFHPSHRNILILSPCSGHGFKFSSAIGEIAQQLLQENKSNLEIDLFKIDRFRKDSEKDE